MKGVYALYPDIEGARRAVNDLRAAGVSAADITVISSVPLEDVGLGAIDAHSRLWYVACVGGLLGMLGGTALVVHASTAWPLNVGNMSTVAWWPLLIIAFETTMLGAVLFTVAGFVLTAGLGRRSVLYDPAVSDGQILVGVEHPNESQLNELDAVLHPR